MFALSRVGQSLPAAAAARFEKMQAQFFGEEQSYVWGQLAVAGAMKHRPKRSNGSHAPATGSPTAKLNWKTRAAYGSRTGLRS
jgi:hypothetical protein